jgi:hypothetical protein
MFNREDYYICKCQHEKRFHNTLNNACSHFTHDKSVLLGMRCNCLEFKLDNLRYLEQKIQEKSC